VGNIPYDVSEKQLRDIFSEVGPVVTFRLVTDRDTGKTKGYGFCEYHDSETALSAMRNLNNRELNGRVLRVDFAETDKVMGASELREASRGGGPSGSSAAGGRGGTTVVQQINSVLEGLSGAQLYELIASMRQFAHAQPQQARHVLAANPQLSFALLQAMVTLGMLNAQSLQQLVQQVTRGPAEPPPPAAAILPPPLPMAVAPPAMVPPAGLPPGQAPEQVEQAKLLEQILTLTPQQIEALPPPQRAQVQAILSALRGSR